MRFETEQDVLQWFQGEERILTKGFLDAIPWAEVKNSALDPAFIPVLTAIFHVRAPRTITSPPFVSLTISSSSSPSFVCLAAWMTG